MQEDYFVLYKRDIEYENVKKYGQKMLYDKMQKFGNYEQTSRFAVMNMPAIVARQYPLEAKKDEIKNLNAPYIVAAKFDGKYRHYCYDGSDDPLVTYDAVRCSENELERVIEEFASEKNFKGLNVGLEIKIFPNFAKDYGARIE
jgi:hypothetical protein